MWMWLSFILLTGLAVGGVLLLLAKLRERTLRSERDNALLANHTVQAEKHALQERLAALVHVEQRYGGIIDLEAAITTLQAQKTIIEAAFATERASHQTQLNGLASAISKLRHELAELTDEEYFSSFGVYSTRYDFPTSESYKAALELIRSRQKDAIKAGTAAICHIPWTVEGSAAKGKKMTQNNLKMMLRAFNGECDAAITKATYRNIAALEKRIERSRDKINKLNTVNRAEITHQYFSLKIEELRLYYEWALKKEEEKQEQRELKEQIREEKQAQQELDRARKRAEDEEARYSAALAKAREDIQKTVGAKQQKMAAKIAELEGRLVEAQANKERAISQAQLTRAGHVYVISNIGSFGDGVLKIGMTRRLDPMDRVKELGDASVPFPFDVHALIRSQDAPKLEKELHQRFDDRRVNLVNQRKEFFQVSLAEIGAAVAEFHGEFEVTRLAAADDYRQSVALRAQRSREQLGAAQAPVAAVSA